MDIDYRALAERLLDFQTLMRLAPIARELDVLDKGTFLALHCLLAEHKTVHPKELSQKMSVSSARIAALLHHMEEEGLVARRPDPNDNRKILVSLTRQGERMIQEKRARVVERMAEALEGLGPEDAETYLRIQMKMVRNLCAKHTADKGYVGYPL